MCLGEKHKKTIQKREWSRYNLKAPNLGLFTIQKTGWRDSIVFVGQNGIGTYYVRKNKIINWLINMYSSTVFKEWHKTIWVPFANAHPRIKILMLDAATVHTCESAKSLFQETETAVFPLRASSTAKLQVLDVGVNAPFKKIISDKIHLFSIANPNQKIGQPEMNQNFVQQLFNLMPEWLVVRTLCLPCVFMTISSTVFTKFY